MDAPTLISTLRSRGIRFIANPPKLRVAPNSLLTDADREAIRAHKSALLAHLCGEARAPEPDQNPASKGAEPSTIRATWTRSPTPDSRSPLVPPEVRAKIEDIEADARVMGWPAELLWNAGFWDCPRGLAAVLDPEDEISEVTADFIAILKTRRELLRFRRHAA